MFGQNQQNQQNNDVTTSIKTLFSPLSCMTISCWNDSFSLKFSPATSAPDANGFTHYDSKAKTQISLSVAEAAALAKRYEQNMQEKVDGKMDPGEGISESVDMVRKEGKHQLTIEYKKDDQGVPSLYLTLTKNVGANGEATNMAAVISYKFNTVGVVDDYNPLTGGGIPYQVEGEFEFFLNILKNAHLMTGLLNHAARVSKQFAKNSGGLSGFLQGGRGGQQQNSGLPQNFMNTYDNGMNEIPFD